MCHSGTVQPSPPPYAKILLFSARRYGIRFDAFEMSEIQRRLGVAVAQSRRGAFDQDGKLQQDGDDWTSLVCHAAPLCKWLTSSSNSLEGFTS